MAEDLRLIANGGTYVEVDPSSHLNAATAATLTLTNLINNEHAYHYEDGGGAGAYADRCYFEGKFNLTTAVAATKGVLFGYGDTVGSFGQQVNSAGIYLYAPNGTAGPFTPYADCRQSSVEIGTAGSTISVATTYYYRVGLLSSIGGQYGAVFYQIFSNSGRTTLVSAAITARTAAGTYRYFYAAMSDNVGSTGTISGTHEDITLFTSSAGLDLTTFTEVDGGTNISVWADIISATTMQRGVTSYVYKDYGASFFSGNYNLKGVFNLTAYAGSWALAQVVNLLSLNNALGKSDDTSDRQSVVVYWDSATQFRLYIQEISGGSSALSSTYITGTKGTQLWLEFYRDTAVGTYGTLYLKAYYDPAYTVQFGSTQSLACRDNGTPDVAAFRYFNAIQSPTLTGTQDSTFTFGGVTATKQGDGALAGDIVTTASFVGSGGAVSTLEGSVVTTAAFIGASVNDGVLAGTSVVTASFVGELFSAGSANLNGNVVTTASFVGASVATGSLAGNAVTTCSFVADTTPSLTAAITCRITKVNSAGQEIGATGLTPTLKFYLVSNSYYRDFSDSAFKPIASCVTLTANMTERDATLAAGRYDYTLQTYGLGSGAKTEYGYDIDATISSSETYMNEGAMIFLDGVEVFPGLTVAEKASVAALPSAAQIATAVRSNLTIELSRIDAAISSITGGAGSGPTAAEVATAVWAKVLTGTLTASQAIQVHNAILAGRVTGAGTGTEVFWNTDGTRDICTITVDAAGNRSLVVLNVP